MALGTSHQKKFQKMGLKAAEKLGGGGILNRSEFPDFGQKLGGMFNRGNFSELGVDQQLYMKLAIDEQVVYSSKMK